MGHSSGDSKGVDSDQFIRIVRLLELMQPCVELLRTVANKVANKAI